MKLQMWCDRQDACTGHNKQWGKRDEHTAGWCQKEKPGVLAYSTAIYNSPEPKAKEGPQGTSS